MTVFASWSGGKDCMLALYRFLQGKNNNIEFLVNMCDEAGVVSRSHGLNKRLIRNQAECIGISLVQKPTSGIAYEKNFKKVIAELKNKGISTGIFGDIYLKEHRVWIERVCNEMEIEPLFPLWGGNTTEILTEFIHTGFKALTVSVRTDKLSAEWVGRTLDQEFLTEISLLENIDPCAENGEYHTFVYDGPLFSESVKLERGDVTVRDNHYFLELT